MVTGNFRMALDSIRSAKLRSFLTMLGIIIGVVSVVTIVSIGEGVKRQISNQINQLGTDLITILPGKAVVRDKSGAVTTVNFMNAFTGTTLTEKDLLAVQKAEGVDTAVPMSFVSGTPKIDTREYNHGFIFGTTDGLPKVLSHKVEYGEFFEEKETHQNVAVIGQRVAEELFQETIPIGRSMQIRGENFVVLGVFEEFETSTLTPTTDYNAAIFIPYSAGKKLGNGQANIQQILAKPTDPANLAPTVTAVEAAMFSAHAGQDDFTILKQQDNLAIANNILNLLTGLISGIAAISLIVGGIGIMNIMLVSVTERTHEIGVRKAVGATNHQILGQFMIEAAMISVVGGLIGVVASIFANFLLRIFTDLQPVVTLPIMGVAVLVSLFVGIFFGIAPALKAAQKDPIQALRQI